MLYTEYYDQNIEHFKSEYIHVLRYINFLCQGLDAKSYNLAELTFENFICLIKDQNPTSISGRRASYYLMALNALYKEMNVSEPDWVSWCTCTAIIERTVENDISYFFKDIESVIKQIDSLNVGDYFNDVKAACVLLWHNISFSEMVRLKKTDIDYTNRTVKSEQDKLIVLSPFETGIIKQYADQTTRTKPYSGKRVTFFDSELLFRTTVLKNKTPLKQVISQRFLTLNRTFKHNGFDSKITAAILFRNGEFYRIKTMGISQYILPIYYRVQYQQYVDRFWKD